MLTPMSKYASDMSVGRKDLKKNEESEQHKSNYKLSARYCLMVLKRIYTFSFGCLSFTSQSLFFFQNSGDSAGEFFLVTNPEFSGSPPRRAPPPIPDSISMPTPSAPVFAPSPVVSTVSRSESFDSTQVQELTVDDIEDFEDDDDLEEVNSLKISRRNPNDVGDLMLKLPSFATGNDGSGNMHGPANSWSMHMDVTSLALHFLVNKNVLMLLYDDDYCRGVPCQMRSIFEFLIL